MVEKKLQYHLQFQQQQKTTTIVYEQSTYPT